MSASAHRRVAAAAALCLLVCGSAGAQVLPQLPSDEIEARAMIAEGALDATLWERLQPFYAEPLRVAAGELTVLLELFPQLQGRLPPPDSLQRYEPWDGGSVRCFVLAYPEVAACRPLLSFESSAGKWGSAAVRLRRGAAGAGERQFVSVSLAPHRSVRFDGRFSFDSTAATWQRRSLRAEAPGAGAFIVGNYSPQLDDGLFLGGFAAPGDSLDWAEQWLLAGSGGFNGACWRAGEARQWALEAVYHHGRHEDAWELAGEERIASWVLLSGGVSLLSRDSAAAQWAGHAGAELEWRGGGLDAAVCGILGNGRLSLPLVVQIRQRAGANQMRLRATALPVETRHAASRLYQSAVEGFEQPPGGDLLSLEAVSDCRIGRSLTLSPFLTYVTDGALAARCDAGFSAQGSAAVDYRLRYAWTPSLAGDTTATKHALTANASRSLCSWLLVKVSARCLVRGRACSSAGLTLAPTVAAGSLLRFTPLLACRWRTGSGWGGDLGLRQELRLSPLVFGACALQAPVDDFSWKEVTLDVALRIAL